VHPDKTRDDRAAEAFNALRDAFDLLADADARKRHDDELARLDRLAQARRERQRAAVAREARRAMGALWRFARTHKRVSVGIVVFLWLLLL
jgi:curved DNA-binding protein CbpA